MNSIELSVFIMVSFLLCIIGYTLNIEWLTVLSIPEESHTNGTKEFKGSIVPFLIAGVVAFVVKTASSKRKTK